MGFGIGSAGRTSTADETDLPSLDLAAVAEETFSDEAVWRGDERYLSVTLEGDSFLSIFDLQTLLDELEFSPAVYERMNRTRALDGTQTATSPVANASWTYHPDNGLQVVFEREVHQ